MDAIQYIDVVEKIKDHLLLLEPGLERKIETLSKETFADKPNEFFQQRLLATLLRLDEDTAEGRRRIRRMWTIARALGQNASAKSKDNIPRVREEWESLYVSFSEKSRKICEDSIASFEAAVRTDVNNQRAFADRLSNASGPVEAIDYTRSILPKLTPLQTAEFLAASWYPIVVPVSPVQRFFMRMRLIEKAGLTRRDLSAFFAACGAIAHHANTPVPVLNFLLRVFTGAAPGWNSALPVCVRSPRCGKCPVTGYCTWFKFNKKPEKKSVRVPIKMWSKSDRPREKLLHYGAGALSRAELLAIIIRTGSGNLSALDLAQKLLLRFKTFEGLYNASVRELCEINGIGTAKAAEIIAALEMSSRMNSGRPSLEDSISGAEDVYKRYASKMERLKVEHVRLLLLNSKNVIFKEHDVSKGSLNSSIVHPRDTLAIAVQEQAASVILLHNHPSGDPDPSIDDYTVTDRIKEASNILGITLLDHIIIARGGFFSFAEAGRL